HANDHKATVDIHSAIVRAVSASHNVQQLPVLIVGDFNAHHKRWGGDKTKVDQRGTELFRLCNTLSLNILNKESCKGVATYRKANRSSVIDLMITNRSDLFHSLTVDSDTIKLVSDHLPLILTSQHQLPVVIKCKPRPRYIWEKADWDTFNGVIKKHECALLKQLHSLFTISDMTPRQIVEEALQAICAVVDEATMAAVPMKTSGGRGKPWWKYDVMLPSIRDEYHKAHRQWVRSKPHDRESKWEEYSIKKKEFRKRVRIAKNEYQRVIHERH